MRPDGSVFVKVMMTGAAAPGGEIGHFAIAFGESVRLAIHFVPLRHSGRSAVTPTAGGFAPGHKRLGTAAQPIQGLRATPQVPSSCPTTTRARWREVDSEFSAKRRCADVGHTAGTGDAPFSWVRRQRSVCGGSLNTGVHQHH